MNNPTMTLYGLKVILSPDRPKMQLSKDCPVTDDFRKEINAWMVEFFGTTNIIPDGQMIMFNELGTVGINPRTHAALITNMDKYTYHDRRRT